MAYVGGVRRPLVAAGHGGNPLCRASWGRLTPAHWTCILRRPARAERLQDVRLSFTSRRWSSRRGADR
jgi:hypothetical protein